MSRRGGLPRLHAWILTRLLPSEERDYVLGDLEEEIRRMARTDPPGARRLVRSEIRGALVQRLKGAGRPPGRVPPPSRGRWVTDFRLAFRSLRRNPTVSAVVIATLALGIGALTAIWSVVDGVLLQPLPFPEPDELVSLCSDHPSMGGFCGASPPDAAEWGRSPAIEGVGLLRDESVRLRSPDGTEGFYAGLVSAGALDVLGTRLHMGRRYTAEEERAGVPVALISYDTWVGRFGSDPAVVGRVLNLDGTDHEIVGVLDQDASIPLLGAVRFVRPLPFAPDDEANRGWRGFRAVGRLADGWTLETADKQLDVVAARIGERLPETNRGWGVRVLSLKERVVGRVRGRLHLFLGAVALLLLVACANVTGVLVARETQRRREMAVRAAMGASRVDLLRILTAEGVVLGVLGGALGVGLAYVLVPPLVRMAPSIPRAGEIGIDGRVLAFTVAATAFAVAIASVVPALVTRFRHLGDALREGAQGPKSLRVHRLIVVAETAFAVALFAGAMLLARSFGTLMSYDGGVERDRLLTAWLLTIDDPLPPGEDVVRTHTRIAEAVEALPGVESTALASAGPLFGGSDGLTRFYDASRPPPPDGSEPSAAWFDVSAGVFRTLGVPVLEGREFTPADDGAAPKVAVVNETFARRHWPSGSAVGQRIALSERGDTVLEIVGVVADIPPLDPEATIAPAMYWPLAQWPRLAAYLVARTSGDPSDVLEEVFARAREVAPETQVSRPAPLIEGLRARTASSRFSAVLVGIFAVTGLLLTAIGVYGVTAYAVSRRTREFGIRVSLGLGRRALKALVVRQALALTVLGTALGLVLVLVGAPLLETSLVSVSARDPWSALLAVVVVLSVGAVAAWIPGRRAARVDPVEVLKAQ